MLVVSVAPVISDTWGLGLVGARSDIALQLKLIVRAGQLNLSLVRLLEIVGEAASRVSAEERVRHRDIAWPEIVGLRNRLIHGYDSVDFDILWQIVSDDLLLLIAAPEKARK